MLLGKWDYITRARASDSDEVGPIVHQAASLIKQVRALVSLFDRIAHCVT